MNRGLKNREKLESVAMALAGIEAFLDEMDDEEIEALATVCNNASNTNCWCWTYQAAQYLKPELTRRLLLKRQRESDAEKASSNQSVVV